MNLKNVEVIEQEQENASSPSINQALKFSLVLALLTMALSANAAMPEVDVADILTYIGLLVAAVATVASASLMIYLAAKGIKALRSAF
ncbi:major capsid protein [Acinetobacter soli]|uniref:major capsid protein n=1 Tax=Acinetobacter soli TaxID=487316 RepID=UPI0032B3839C